MDEEQLIQLVETRSYLYDTSSFHYKNVNKVAAAWREIARELKVSDPEQCKNKWKSLRDTFNRLRKVVPPSGSEGGGKKEWRHLKSMWFLLPHLRERCSRSSLEGDVVRTEEEEGGERSEEVEVEDEDEDERRVDVESGERAEREVRRNDGEERQLREQRDEGERAHSYSSKRRKQKKSWQGNPPRNPSTEDLYEILRTPIQPDDPDEMFLLSLLPELKQVTTNKGQLKAQLLTTILNWDNNQVFHPPPQPYHLIPPHHSPYYFNNPNNPTYEHL